MAQDLAPVGARVGAPVGARAPRAQKIRVLLADDEPLVRGGLSMLISAEPGLEVVAEAADSDEAVRYALDLRPCVAVLDVRMPGGDGLAATAQLLGEDFRCRTGGFSPAVLILTTFNDDSAVHDALRAGASGFMLKSAAVRALGDAIRAVAAGDAWLDPAVARKLLAEFSSAGAPRRAVPAALHALTARESEVLELVAHGLTNAQIGAHLVLSEATVKTHVARIMAKLDVHDRAQAVTCAYRSGLVRPDDHLPRGHGRLATGASRPARSGFGRRSRG